MVHLKIFVPKPKPVTDVVGESEFVIIPDPDTSVHSPVPEVATFPAIVAFGEEMQTV